MAGSQIPAWVLIASAGALSVAAVTAFTAADTGARTVTASVVTDANAYLALAVNSGSPHAGFGSVSGGKVTFAFDGANLAAAGDGINVDGSYEFDSVVTITNSGTESRSVDATVGGADSAICTLALTTTSDQSGATYAADPSPITLAKDAVGYLGLGVAGTGKTTGSTVACTFTVTAG